MEDDIVQLSEAATNALRELAISGPGIPGPDETDELVDLGLASRCIKITPAGEEAAARIPGFRLAHMRYAIDRAREAVAHMEANVPPEDQS